MMELITILGLFAAFLTTVASIPQVIKTWKTKHAKDLSLSWLILFASGLFFWLVYGILIGDLPLIFANSISLLLALSLLVMKRRFG
jgi:MtN3 and saliva related transmembrane protein